MTPLIDIMFTLIIFFLATATFQEEERDIAINVPPNTAGTTLSSEPRVMVINGKEVGAGVGGDILGHPLNALVWLADLRGGQGRPLKAGEFVTLGSLVRTVWVEEGDEIIAEVEGLGRAVLTL